MNFLQPFLLYGLFAASIPVIIHLLNRRRHRTVRWAAMQFLLKATRESRGKKKLKYFLILACRTLGLAALVFAAARPLIGGFLGWGTGTVDTVVLILDRSASMEATQKDSSRPRRQTALEQVSAALAELGDTRLVLLDSASGEPQEVPSPDVLPDLSSTAATDTDTDLPMLLERAVDLLAEGAPGRSEIWIASDLQRDDWRPESDRWQTARAGIEALPQPPALRILAMNAAPAPNTALRTLAVRRTGKQLEIEFELLRQDDMRQSISLPLTLAVDGVRTTDTVGMEGDVRRFLKRVPLPEGTGEGFGWASIPADGNPRDNVAFFAFGEARSIRSAVVADKGEAADYLMLAAAPPGLANREVELITPAQAATLKWDDLACVIWAAPLPQGPVAQRAQRFVDQGGTLLLWPSGEESENEFLGITWGAPEESPRGKFFIIDTWDRDDGLLRDGLDGTPLATDRLNAIRRQSINGEAAVLARWDDNSPLLVRHAGERGAAWFIGTLPDYGWSNIGDGDLLLPAVQRSILDGANRFDTGHLATVGSKDAAALPGQDRTRADDYGIPDPANSDYEAGIWNIDGRMVAANRPATEDRVEQLTGESLDQVLSGTDYSLFQESRAEDPDKLFREAWRAFLLAMILFLFGEALLCLPARRKDDPSAEPTSPQPAS